MIICLAFSGCTWFEKKTDETTIFVDTSNPTFTMNGTTSTAVPLPNDEDVIRNLFALIDEDRVSEAVSDLHTSMIQDESTKQAWGVNFNTIDSVKIMSIAESDKIDWTTAKHIYKVALDIKTKDGAQFMGWENGENIRWIHLAKDGNNWKVTEIATGP